MLNGKSKKVDWKLRVLGFFVIMTAATAMVLASAQATFPQHKEVKSKPTISLKKSFDKLSRAVTRAAILSQYKGITDLIDMKAIEAEGERQAQAKRQMVLKMGGGDIAEVDNGLDPDDPDYMNKLQHDKWSWIIAELERQKGIMEAEIAKQDMINRIDAYLARRGSPMTGLGHVFFDEAAKYGIDPRLSVAISEGESSCGLACFAPYNAWGMLAYGGLGSWENGIRVNVELLHKNYGSPQTAFECVGYCVPDHPWMENVDGVRRCI